MLTLLRENWWLLTLRGVVGILFGLGTFLVPGITLAVLVAMFGAYAFVDGAFSLASVMRHGRKGARSGAVIFRGIVGIMTGIATWFWPGMTVLALILMIATWAIITGAAEVAAAIRLRSEIEGEWLLGLSGLASMAFGVALFLRPAAGGLAVLWLIGAYAFALGLLLIMLSISLRVGGRHPPPSNLAHA